MEYIKSIIYYAILYACASYLYGIVVRIWNKHKSISSEPTEDFSKYTLILDASEWYSEVTINPIARTAYFYSHTPDYDYISHSTYQYKIDGTSIYMRLISDYSDHYGRIERNVMDGVVLESEIIERHDGTSFLSEPLESKINKLQSQLKWDILLRRDLKYFIFSKHDDVFKESAIRRMIRIELEKLRASKRALIAKATNLGLEVTPSDEGFEILFPEQYPEGRKAEVQRLFAKESLEEIGINLSELNSFKKIESDLLALIGENAA